MHAGQEDGECPQQSVNRLGPTPKLIDAVMEASGRLRSWVNAVDTERQLHISVCIYSPSNSGTRKRRPLSQLNNT